MHTSETDIHHMRSAIALARRGLGRVAPNPAVGCVIVKNGRVIASARTADGGRPHAESIALEQAGQQAKGACAYVSLEPCAHEGLTPPCAKALVEAGVARVVVGTLDPDPRVAGRGIAILKAAGIAVETGVMEEECRALNKGFFLRIEEGRPLVTLKTACSLDGKVALKNGKSQWITGELARRHVHLLRSQHDAILCGIGTVKADDPLLTTRLSGVDHTPVRVVLDGDLETPMDSRLVASSKDVPLWIFYINDHEGKGAALEQAGVRLFRITEKTVAPILKILAEEGLTRVLVEGGRWIHSAFLREGFCDALYLYRAPCVLGADAYDAFVDLGLEDLTQRLGLTRQKTRVLGQDLLEIYAPSA